MNAVVIGGHTRNIGKTSLMTGLIRHFASLDWTAVKITQYGHGICSIDGKPCGCDPGEHGFALTEERNPGGRSDTSRFLAAGARRSLWLRARQGQLGTAVPALREALAATGWVMIESNSILEFLNPALYLQVVDTAVSDFKASARRYLDRADAIALVGPRLKPTFGRSSEPGFEPGAENLAGQAWGGLCRRSLEEKPVFAVCAPDYLRAELTDFVDERLRAAMPPPEGKEVGRGAWF